MKLSSLRFFVLTLVVAAAGLPATVRAQTPTVIDHLPYTITNRGLYVLNNDLSSSQTSGNLIEIDANNVTVDLQGHYISGPVNSSVPGPYGIYAVERNNITVRNGTIANARTGIYLAGNDSTTTNNLNHELDHLRVTRCLSNGIYLVYAASASVTNCKLSFIGDNSGGASAIKIVGPGVTMQGCLIS